MKTMINIQRCNVGEAEQHNSREKNYIAAVNASPKKRYSIFEDRTASNLSWVNPEYSGKSLQEIFENQKKLYTEKTGQKPQLKDRVRVNKKTGKEYTVSGWSPIREAVVLVKDDTRIEDFTPFTEWMKKRGVRTIRIDIHRDEGHTDELSGERKYNLHAHLIFDYINPGTGKTVKLPDDDLPEMQTKIAEALGMERGESKELTEAEHLTPDDYRAKKAAQKVKELEAKKKELETKIRKLEMETDLKKLRGQLVYSKNFVYDILENIVKHCDTATRESIEKDVIAADTNPPFRANLIAFLRKAQNQSRKAEPKHKGISLG